MNRLMANSTIPEPLARSVALRLFIVLRHTLDPARLSEHIAAHLEWMISQEKLGRIFLSGPTAGNSGNLDGLTILRCADQAEAEQVTADDPFVRSGCVRYEIYAWTAYEGCLQLMVRLSDSTAVVQ